MSLGSFVSGVAEVGKAALEGVKEINPVSAVRQEFPDMFERPDNAGVKPSNLENLEGQNDSWHPWQNSDGTPDLSKGGLLDNIAQELNNRDIPNPDVHFDEEGHYYQDADGAIKYHSEETPKYDWDAEGVYDRYFSDYDANPESVDLGEKTKELADLLNDSPDLSKGSPMDNLARDLNDRDLPSPWNEGPSHDDFTGRDYWSAKDAYNDFGQGYAEHPEFPDKEGNFPQGGKVETLTDLLNSGINEGETPLTTKDVYERFFEPLNEKSPVAAKLEEFLNA